jgi:tRNA modification GTPase
LIDTAGIREHTTDVLESAGMERSLEKMKQADLVLYLFDAGEMKIEVKGLKSELDKQKLNYLLIANKIDVTGETPAKERFSDIEGVVFISAKQKLHTEVLKEKMVDAVLKGKLQTENTIVTNARHYHALKEVQKSLTDIKNGLGNKLPGDLLALDIRRCLHYLGEITGEITNEDQLDYIFSKFCIGK